MSLIVAGRFDTFDAGERAAQKLFGRGFLEEDVYMFFVNPRGRHDRFPIGGDQNDDPGMRGAPGGAGKGVVLGAIVGAVIGVAVFLLAHAPLIATILAAGVGAWLGSLVGAMNRTRRQGEQPAAPGVKPVRTSGVLLAVHVGDESQAVAATVLREAGAEDVERAAGLWNNGRWSDFDPLEPPHVTDIGSGPRRTSHAV